MNKKKILVIFPLLPKYDVDFFEQFVSMFDFEIFVVADIENKNDLTLSQYNNSFTAIHSDIKKLGPFEYTIGLSKIISTVNPDLIIYSASPRDLGQMFSIIKNKILGKKIAVWSMFHRIGGPRIYSSIYYMFLGFIANRNLTYSKTGKYYQIARGVNPQKIDIIGTAIDEKKVFNVISKNDVSTDELKLKYNLNNKFILLQVLRLTSIKKPHFLIDMMQVLTKKEPNAVLVLIGGGAMEQEIKNYVVTLKLEENVLFLGPIYDDSVLNTWFRLSHLFVIPTCIGLSAHHACCYGLPIITDNSLENQASEFDILQDRLNCLLYDTGSLESFVEKIIELKTNKELYKRISQNAIITVKEIYTLEAKALNLKESIDKILKKG